MPQELGDFGVLVQGGWRPRRALLFNLLSALTFPLGGALAWSVSGRIETAWLVPFAAGNFLYIGAADLIPEVKEEAPTLGRTLGHLACFAGGFAILAALSVVFTE